MVLRPSLHNRPMPINLCDDFLASSQGRGSTSDFGRLRENADAIGGDGSVEVQSQATLSGQTRASVVPDCLSILNGSRRFA